MELARPLSELISLYVGSMCSENSVSDDRSCLYAIRFLSLCGRLPHEGAIRTCWFLSSYNVTRNPARAKLMTSRHCLLEPEGQTAMVENLQKPGWPWIIIH